MSIFRRKQVKNLTTTGDVIIYVMSDRIVGVFPLKEEDMNHFRELAIKNDSKATLTFNWTDKGEQHGRDVHST